MLNESHRWRDHLCSASDAYRDLHAERLAGWQSSALDQWYKQRQRHDTLTAKTETTNTTPATTTTTAAAAAAPLTVFAGADIAKLCERYAAHAARVLPLAAPDYFCTSPRGSFISPRFLDLGCAPGGVSKYLSMRLRWHGVGVTLSEQCGGIAMDKSWAPQRPPRYTLVEGSVTANDWHGAIAGTEFFFVNGGAVQDHGQREGERLEAEGGVANSEGAVLPWFTLLVPQLRTAMEYVENGGAVMFVFGMPHCASLAILIAMLKPIVHGRVRVFETMHLSKAPVYVLLTGVSARRNDTAREVWTSTLNKMTMGEKAFWLGETDEGFALAKEGFDVCRVDLEAVWQKTTLFLGRRRLQAEKEMEPKGKERTHDGPSKRPRDDK